MKMRVVGPGGKEGKYTDAWQFLIKNRDMIDNCNLKTFCSFIISQNKVSDGICIEKDKVLFV
jgi:hypothetical protein